MMKSFQLDPKSSGEFRASLPGFLVAAIICGGMLYFEKLRELWLPLLVLLSAVQVGVLLRGIAAGRLGRKYPKAKHVWLYSVGMVTLTICLPVQFLFPDLFQDRWFQCVWLGLPFCSILAFVILNRKNREVVK